MFGTGSLSEELFDAGFPYPAAIGVPCRVLGSPTVGDDDEVVTVAVLPERGCGPEVRVRRRQLDGAEPVLVSACLAGVPCRYDGRAKTSEAAVGLVEDGRAVVVCPEVAGGLATPRPAAEIVGGDGADVLDGRARVVDATGADCTEAFLDGARQALAAAEAAGARRALLMARSPSCGCGQVYDGSFDRTLRAGDGVTAALLRRAGVVVTAGQAG
ncbi:DUF523 domain-containing protein [Streptomyces sp. CB01881]|nr:hypothetical protein C2142_11590 [Streptomyces sp. CB01881]TYC75055.1 DUF523 domain-containing protein [Streptomyces sp. CB01881]